jgi:hypothetical protein
MALVREKYKSTVHCMTIVHEKYKSFKKYGDLIPNLLSFCHIKNNDVSRYLRLTSSIQSGRGSTFMKPMATVGRYVCIWTWLNDKFRNF